MSENKSVGRPKKHIDYKLVEQLTSIHCTQQEIASALGLSLRKLQNDEQFMHIYKEGIDDAKKSLRRMQWDSAKKGNTTMLVWLGKQYLKQSDKQEVEATVNTSKLDSLIEQLNDTDEENE